MKRTVTAILFYSCTAFYSRSTAELNGGEGTGWAVRVREQVSDGDADGHDSHRVGVGLVKHGAQALDGLGSSQRGLHSIHRLQGGREQGGQIEEGRRETNVFRQLDTNCANR